MIFYLYGGKQYKLRWLTLFASDDPAMTKATQKNLLSSKVISVIQNCLDSAIQTYVSMLSPKLRYLGTVASICGLSVSNFGTAQKSTLSMNAGTNWTARFTQVFSTYDNAWLNGCCVEEANLVSYMSGLYYSASLNRNEQVPDDKVIDHRKSSKFDDFDWRKENAVLGYIGNSVRYDIVGDVQYQYNGSVVVTHRHDF